MKLLNLLALFLLTGLAVQAQKYEDGEVNKAGLEKFGEYKKGYTRITPDKILCKRSLLINEGVYANSYYMNYRQFREKTARNDNAKVVLVKNN